MTIWGDKDIFDIKPTQVMYNTMIQAMGRSTHWVFKAFDYFEEMKLVGTGADETTYRIILHACSRAGDSLRAVKAIDEMKSAGYPLPPCTPFL